METPKLLSKSELMAAFLTVLIIGCISLLSCNKKKQESSSNPKTNCQLLSVIDENKQVYEKINYDGNGKILSVEIPDHYTLIPVYDPLTKKLDSVIYHGDITGSYVYWYDSIGRLTEIDRNTNEFSDYNTTVYLYNGASSKPWEEQQKKWTAPNNLIFKRAIDYKFDGNGNIISAKNLQSGDIDSFSYDTKRSLNIGLEFVDHTLASWNPNYALTNFKYSLSSSSPAKTFYSYLYDGNGNVTQSKVVNSQGTSFLDTYNWSCK